MIEAIIGMFSNTNVQFYVIAYLIGGIPFGLILAKIFANTDLRTSGSGNIGATNVLRVVKEKNPTLAKKLAITTVILDALKGFILIVLIGFMLDGKQEDVTSIQWTVGIMTIIGHCFSPYLGFEGGKGVATSLGVVLYFLPIEVLIAFATWFALGKIVKISSVSSLGALSAFVVSSYILHFDMPHIHTHAPIFIITILIVYKHLPNISRLFSGKEEKIA